MNKHTIIPRSVSAFTLIETLVAISILLISLVGPLAVAAQALKSAYFARDEITAFYLAQEGLEYVRAVRDQNFLAGNSWLTGLTLCETSSCNIDFPNFTVAQCPSGGCPPLLIDPTTNLFNTKNGTPSIFTRTLTISTVTGTTDEVVINMQVSWRSAGISRSFTLSEHIFNWL